MRILLLGGDADGNLGDRAILRSICDELRRIRDDVELTAVSRDPQRVMRECSATFVRRGVRGMPGLCAAALRSDVVICGGGGLFQDDDSLVKMPYWLARVLLARLLCRRVIGYSLGVGPLDAWTSRVAARLTFGLMRRVSVRDPRARRTAQPLTGRTVEIVPDPALMLAPVDDRTARRYLIEHDVPVDGPPLVGVAPRRYFPAQRRWVPNIIRSGWRPIDLDDSDDAQRLTSLLAETLDRVIERHGAHVVFMPTYRLTHEGDNRVADLIRGKMSAGAHTHVLSIDDTALYKGITRRLAVLLGGRMHPTIFAASMGTPVVGLAYNQKFHGFFELIDRSDALIDIDGFIREGCTKRLVALIDAAMQGENDLAQRCEALAGQTRSFTAEIIEDAA